MKYTYKTQQGFTVIALMIATVILIIASLSYTENYQGIKEHASMNVYQASQDRLEQVKRATGLGGGSEAARSDTPQSRQIDLGLDDTNASATSSGSPVTVSSTTSTEAKSMPVKLFYVVEDASGGEAEQNGKVRVCNSYFMTVGVDSYIDQTKETIKGSVSALSHKERDPEGMEFGPFNFITAEQLSFKSASISSGIANVKLVHNATYLSQNTDITRLNNFNISIGLSLTKEIRDCVIKKQIETTVMQFGTAKSINLYIDDKMVK